MQHSPDGTVLLPFIKSAHFPSSEYADVLEQGSGSGDLILNVTSAAQEATVGSVK